MSMLHRLRDTSDHLRDTLTTVLTELERLDPQSLIAARARGIIDTLTAIPVKPGPKTGWRKQATDADRSIAADYLAGDSAVAVGQKHGVSMGTVFAALKRTETPARTKGAPRGNQSGSSASRERVARMTDAHAGGKTLEEISVSEGITRERVRQILRKAGIDTSPRSAPLTDKDRDAVARYVAGETLALVANGLGVTEAKFKNILTRAGHVPRKAPKFGGRHASTIANAERAAQLYAEGVRTADIARQIGVKQPAVYRLLAYAGVKATRAHARHTRPGAFDTANSDRTVA